MRHVRMLGLCLVAVMAFGAWAVSSASALPEFGECVAKSGGKYSDSNCTVKAKKGTGAYEWVKESQIEASRRHISGESGRGVLKTNIVICDPGQKNVKECAAGEERNEAPLEVECSSQQNAGEISGSKTVTNVTVVFHGCALEGTIPCANSPEAGEIIVNTLKGELGYINKSAKEVGVLLEPKEKGPGFATFTCGTFATTHVGGAKSSEFPYYAPKGGGMGIISPITPVNTMTKTFTQTYSVSEGDENIPSMFGGKKLTVLEDWIQVPSEPQERSKWSAAGEELTDSEHDCNGKGNGFACGEQEKYQSAGEIKA